MSVGGLGNSESLTKQTVSSSPVSVSDQGVVYQPRAGGKGSKINSPNTRFDIKLGKGASYTVNNGVGAEDLAHQFDNFAKTIADGLATATATNHSVDTNAGGGADTVTGAVNKRLEDQIENAPDDAANRKHASWILIGAIGFIALSLVLLLGRKKKA